jgi:formylglycine-generating enzyme required for sulfatase activity
MVRNMDLHSNAHMNRMKLKMLLILMAMTLQGCTAADHAVRIFAAPSPEQNIIEVSGKEFVSSRKKDLVLLSPYSDLEKFKLKIDKTIFQVFVRNCGDKPVKISYDNISVKFKKNNNGAPDKINFQSFDDFMEYIGKEISESDRRWKESVREHIRQSQDMADMNLIMSELDDLKYNSEKRHIQWKAILEKLDEFVMRPQTIMPGKGNWFLVVCDTSYMNNKEEGNFQVTVSVDGEEHRFTFNRSMFNTKVKPEPEPIKAEQSIKYPLDLELIETPPKVSKESISPEPTISSSSFINSLGMKFVYINPGTFMMGSPKNEVVRDNNEKQHKEIVTEGFYMGETEVTQGQWKAIMGNNPSGFKECGNDCPVEQVSWYDVQEFIKRLNDKEGANKYRLPTNIEWEYSCRAGSASIYYFGDDESDLKEYAWYSENSSNVTHPVGGLKPNAWGLYDMLGNVWEWTQDRDYRKSSLDTPPDFLPVNIRVKRSGSFSCEPTRVRSANQSKSNPKTRVIDIGFRLVMTY